MEKKNNKKTGKIISIVFLSLTGVCLSGCGVIGGYSNKSLYPENITSVYVEMFDNQSFWRDVEYELTDALAKRIEARTPYKIVSSRDRADSVISGQIETVSQSVLSNERETGRPLEKEVEIRATVIWINLKTGELLIDNDSVAASASFSQWQGQGFRYSSALAANKLAQKIVELMETPW